MQDSAIVTSLEALVALYVLLDGKSFQSSITWFTSSHTESKVNNKCSMMSLQLNLKDVTTSVNIPVSTDSLLDLINSFL